MSLEISRVKLGFFEKGNNVFKTKDILGFGPAKMVKSSNDFTQSILLILKSLLFIHI